VLYFTELDKGFAVELGIPSLSTLESLKASMAAADQWPVSDAWAYHDWHQKGNGDTHPFVEHMERQLGVSATLEEFERRAQMFNYVLHRAIFEGFNAHLWTPNSGRMLWMTQPAWPSNMWQILSSDYDTQASYYGVKTACEPLHVQLDLSDNSVAAINTTRDAAQVTVRAAVYSTANELLLTQTKALTLGPNRAQGVFGLGLEPVLAAHGLVFVELTLEAGAAGAVSHNFYWVAAREEDYRALNGLKPARLAVAAKAVGEGLVRVTVENVGDVAALAVKLTPKDAATGERMLPVYLSDNYFSLMPGERREIEVRGDVAGPISVGVRGWNVAGSAVSVGR
jgi:hypothetical protein